MSHDLLINKGVLKYKQRDRAIARLTRNKEIMFKKMYPGENVQLTTISIGEPVPDHRECNEDQRDDEYYFHGYADGLFYQLFNAKKHDKGISGDLQCEIYSRDKMMDVLTTAVLMLREKGRNKEAATLLQYVYGIVEPSGITQKFTVTFM